MLRTTLLFVFGLTLVACRPDPFYRKDYTYVDQFDAFYKVHWDVNGHSLSQAFLACDDEESTLFYPKMKDEWTVVKTLVAAMKEKPNVTDIIVGMHDEFGLGEFITIDGIVHLFKGLPTPSPVVEEEQTAEEGKSTCVTMDIDTGKYKMGNCEAESVKPFVCKKKDVGCPTVDSEYTHVKELKKCYKVHQRKKTWYDAMQTCFIEGGVLAVIEESTEAEIIKQMLRASEDYFVGFRRLFSGNDFYTVKGLKSYDKFYTNWNSNDDTKLDCGTVFKYDGNYNLYTKTKNCYELASFVCEMALTT